MNVFIRKKLEFDTKKHSLIEEIYNSLNIKCENLTVTNCYTLIGNISTEQRDIIASNILAEINVDDIFYEISPSKNSFAYKFLDGQYDCKADYTSQCILMRYNLNVDVICKTIVDINEDISLKDLNKIKKYLINDVDSTETEIDKVEVRLKNESADKIQVLNNFINLNTNEIDALLKDRNFSMDLDDLLFCQKYFQTEKRNPTITELKVLDTYWSDHCRHTTFNTKLENVIVESSPLSTLMEGLIDDIKSKNKNLTLMRVAIQGAKTLKEQGFLQHIDESDEINACSVKYKVKIQGKDEDVLVMFKNETHNHPTEIEPFGGAATCLGGAIRDPLSGRSYVYQAMRITGSGNPNKTFEETLPGKLMQKKITKTAADGYSSYGNQIGIATGFVKEIYDDGYIAKRMEVGAVIGSVRAENVRRETPLNGDKIILLGGRTGRDGVDGATGSSKSHNKESILKCGSQVQKGNAVEERKIQRLFKNPEVCKLIKKCNDFGAGGISVAIGELSTSGIKIDLDNVKKKYDGLDGTEIALSESQERMALVIEEKDVNTFMNLAFEENLEATVVGEITNSGYLEMLWQNETIVNISYDFIETNGSPKVQNAKITNQNFVTKDISFDKDSWLKQLKDLNSCSQKGLVDMFDSTIGKGTVTMPFGGKYQKTQVQSMTALIPESDEDCTTFSYGFNLEISKQNQFLGSMYSVIESVTKLIIAGGNPGEVYLSFQEYFQKLGTDDTKWGKVLASLLGAYYAQINLKMGAIGGKDSMSGTFEDLHVPETLISFAITKNKATQTVTPEFKSPKNKVILLKLRYDENNLPDFEYLLNLYDSLNENIKEKNILSSSVVLSGGIPEAITNMALGNGIGFTFSNDFNPCKDYNYNNIIIECNSSDFYKNFDYIELGETTENNYIQLSTDKIFFSECDESLTHTLKDVFKDSTEEKNINCNITPWNNNVNFKSNLKAKPKVIIPVFPGTNCEYDTLKSFEEHGAICETYVINNLNYSDIKNSLNILSKKISEAQILAFAGGFSAQDQPDGSAKYIVSTFSNDILKNTVNNFVDNSDGLILGICNGFQALVKMGLLPYGKISDQKENSPTLTYNTIGRHISKIVTTKVTSNLSPWYNLVNVGDVHSIAVSHGEGKFVADDNTIQELIKNGQITTQYVDHTNTPTMAYPYNPNGSFYAIEGICSKDGRILGKMGHSERFSKNLFTNISGNKDDKIFQSGVNYFS